MLKRYLPAITIMLFIFLLSSLPGATVDAVGLGKESYHINGHFILFFLLCLAFYRGTQRDLLRSLLFSLCYAFLDEFHQAFVPGRNSGWFDIFVDSTGILLAGVILWRFYPHLPKKLKNWLKK